MLAACSAYVLQSKVLILFPLDWACLWDQCPNYSKLCSSFLSKCTIISSIFGKTLQKRWSIFVKRELVGKIAGFDSVLDSAQTWRARGHSKNTWFIDSLPAPHLAQHMSPCIPLASKFFFTVMHPDTICHKKCFIFGGHRTFQQNAFKISTVGPKLSCDFSLSR